MSVPKQPKLVLIEWVDSHSGRGWRDLDQIEEDSQVLHCRSVGWLVSSSGGCKTVVSSLAGDSEGGIIAQGCGDMTIPNKAIVKIEVLR